MTSKRNVCSYFKRKAQELESASKKVKQASPEIILKSVLMEIEFVKDK